VTARAQSDGAAGRGKPANPPIKTVLTAGATTLWIKEENYYDINIYINMFFVGFLELK